MATTIMAIDTISTLRTTVGAADQSIYLQGYYGINDGGEGSFTWSTTSTAADDGGLVIQPAGVSGAGRWLRGRSMSRSNAKWYGAAGNGQVFYDASMPSGSSFLTSNSASFQASDVGKTIYVHGAGVGGGVLSTTITAVSSSTTVTLNTAASASVTAACYAFANDDTAILSKWLASGGPYYLPPGRYLVTSGLAAIADLDLQGEGTFFFPNGVIPLQFQPPWGPQVAVTGLTAGYIVQNVTVSAGGSGYVDGDIIEIPAPINTPKLPTTCARFQVKPGGQVAGVIQASGLNIADPGWMLTASSSAGVATQAITGSGKNCAVNIALSAAPQIAYKLVTQVSVASTAGLSVGQVIKLWSNGRTCYTNSLGFGTTSYYSLIGGRVAAGGQGFKVGDFVSLPYSTVLGAGLYCYPAFSAPAAPPPGKLVVTAIVDGGTGAGAIASLSANGWGATATATVSAGGIASVTVVKTGWNYPANSTVNVNFVDGQGSGAVATVPTDANGRVIAGSYTPFNPGVNYSSPTVVVGDDGRYGPVPIGYPLPVTALTGSGTGATIYPKWDSPNLSDGFIEQATIRKIVDGNNFLLDRMLYFPHVFDANNPPGFRTLPAAKLSIEGISFQAAGDPQDPRVGPRASGTFRIIGAVNPQIRKVHFYSAWERCIDAHSLFMGSIDFSVGAAVDAPGSPTLTYGYGISISSGSIGTRVTGTAVGCRHFITGGSYSYGYYDTPNLYAQMGCTFNIHCYDCVSYAAHGGNSFDTHEPCAWWTFENCRSLENTADTSSSLGTTAGNAGLMPGAVTMTAGFGMRGYASTLIGCISKGHAVGFRDLHQGLPFLGVFGRVSVAHYIDCKALDMEGSSVGGVGPFGFAGETNFPYLRDPNAETILEGGGSMRSLWAVYGADGLWSNIRISGGFLAKDCDYLIQYAGPMNVEIDGASFDTRNSTRPAQQGFFIARWFNGVNTGPSTLTLAGLSVPGPSLGKLSAIFRNVSPDTVVHNLGSINLGKYIAYLFNLTYKTISGLTWAAASGGTVTATVAAHGYNSGIQVTIQNALPMEYNGVFTITVIDANSFSYPLPSNPGAAIAKGQVTNNVINSMQYGDLMTGSGSPMGIKTPDFIGQRYRDATNNRAYIALTMSNSGWGTIGEQARVQSGPITGNYTTRPGDNLLEVDCTTGPVTITLGTAASNSGTELKIVKIDSGANSVSFTKQSSTDSLIGVASLTAQGAGLRLTSNGLASSQGRWTAG